MNRKHLNEWEQRHLQHNTEHFDTVTPEDYLTLLQTVMVKYQMPFSILDDKDFQKLLQAERNWKLPSRYIFKTNLFEERERKQEQIRRFYESQEFLKGTITHDGWSNRCGLHYLSLRFHFIDDDFQHHSHILDLKLMDNGGTANAHVGYIEEVLQKFDLKTPVSPTHTTALNYRIQKLAANALYAVHDNAVTNNATTDRMDMTSIGCSAHLLDLTIRDIFKLEDFKPIYKKAKKLSNHFRAPKPYGILKQIQLDRNERPKKTLKYAPTRWGSFIQVISRLLELKRYIIIYFRDIDDDFEHCLNETEWDILIDLHSMLKILVIGIRKLEGDNTHLDIVLSSLT